MDVSRLMILLKEAWSRVRDEGVGVMGDFIGKPFTATTMSELNYLVNAPLESINRELREELGIELYVNTLPQIEDHSVSGFLMDADEDNTKIAYISDEYDIPCVQISVRTEHRDLYVDVAVEGSYHVGGSELDIVTDTIYELTQAGILEVVSEESEGK